MAHYNVIQRRLVALERTYNVWLTTLTDAELDELVSRIPADERAVLDALTDDELERLHTGRITSAEWTRLRQQARQR